MRLLLLCVLTFIAATIAPAFAREAQPVTDAPRPALWRVSDADSEIYLFAAAPFLPEGEAWRSREVARAIDEADSIWFEAPSADPAARAAAARIFEKTGRYIAGATLPAALGEDGAAKLAAATLSLEAPPASFDALKPWAAFVVMSAELDRKRGANPAAGVEGGVLKEAVGRQRPVQFLDSVEGALGVLTDMPEKDQVMLLAFLFADWTRREEEAGAMFDLWRTGAVDDLSLRLKAPLKDAAPAAYERLVSARAALLAERIAPLLEGEDEAFVCLGAMLVIGEDGVAAALAAQGFTVERIDLAP